MLAVAGATVTDATGTALTVIADVPFCPSLVAVMVAEPAVTPLTSPLPFTVASAVLLVAQVTERPLKGLPFASLGVAASCTVSPTITLTDDGLTATDATGRRPRLCTREDADRLSCELVAVTRKSPPAVSAVYMPPDVIVPPEALQVAATLALSPFEARPYATNFVCCAGSTVILSGTTTT